MKKTYKEFYKPSKKIRYIDVPAMNYITVCGQGNPNDNPQFQKHIELLYKFSYAIRMSYKKDIKIDGFEIYTVGPLEGIWTTCDDQDYDQNKDKLVYKLMINQPSFVTEDVFKQFIEPLIAIDDAFLQVKFETIQEGECVQVMHVGSYDTEPDTLAPVYEELAANQWGVFPESHHEIYLSDFRKTKAENLKTLIRYRIKK